MKTKRLILTVLLTFVLTTLITSNFMNVATATTEERWFIHNPYVDGLGDIGGNSSPCVAFNVTGDGNWTLITGSFFGMFYGYYWDGNQWVSDASRVSGLGDIGDYSTPSVAFNVTGDDSWTLIAGEYEGGFYGFYWNGTGWSADSSRVAGLGDIGDKSNSYMAFNVTGDDSWTLIAGETWGKFFGFYWGGSEWVSDSSRITGLGDVGYSSTPRMAFNVTGDDSWTLIAGETGGVFNGFYWNGSGWSSDSNRVAGLGDIGANSAPCIAFNITGDSNWTLIAGESGGIFHGYYWGEPIPHPPVHHYYYMGDDKWFEWRNKTSYTTGLDELVSHSSPCVAFNVTGDGNWTLIAGDWTGIFYGYYWNGTQWVSDVSRVSGLEDTEWASKPSLAFDVTGDGKWTLISGAVDGVFYGYYWNGTGWSSDSNRVTGLSVDWYSTPRMAFNVTGDDSWTLISGDGYGVFYGFYWDVSQWVSDSSRVAGLGDIGWHSTPSICFNITGGGNWTLIAGEREGVFNGFYWNGSGWSEDANRIVNLPRVPVNYYTPSLAFNVTGDGNWTLIAGEEDGGFHGYCWYKWNSFSFTLDGTRYVGTDAVFSVSMWEDSTLYLDFEKIENEYLLQVTTGATPTYVTNISYYSTPTHLSATNLTLEHDSLAPITISYEDMEGIYVYRTDLKLASLQHKPKRIELEFSGTGEGIFQLYCGDLGEPQQIAVDGLVTTWDYDINTNILTFTVTCGSIVDAYVDWTLPGAPPPPPPSPPPYYPPGIPTLPTPEEIIETFQKIPLLIFVPIGLMIGVYAVVVYVKKK